MLTLHWQWGTILAGHLCREERMKKSGFSVDRALLAGGVALLVGVFLWKFPHGSSEWASWVQAFGTIGAIAGAFHVGAAQAKSAQETALLVEQNRRTEREGGIHGVIEHLALETVQVMKQAVSGLSQSAARETWNARLGPRLEAAISMFDSLPAHEIGGIERLRVALEIRKSADHLCVSVASILNRDLQDPAAWEDARIAFSENAEIWAQELDQRRGALAALY
ncbi:hypothetical protein J2732_001966 [Achromobacter deleyi]|uniref:hypothetical protein n=1 Tax=Achromobacter deleyi TaxID=1353891 RepID=UPI002858BCE9|nr:hypothetical protein [Achromobacter deleyi]MDR6600983.1 hypothetical protein [Achromobacter deleyi]